MALPIAGIAANLLLGAAIGGAFALFGGGRGKNNSSTTPTQPNRNAAASRPAPYLKQPFQQGYNANAAAAVNQSSTNTSSGVQVTQAVRPASPQAKAKPETVRDRANEAAQEIQRLPVFTPTAPTLSTQNYTSQRRADVLKTKAGEQQLRNPLAIDKDATASTIKDNLPTIGVSASGTDITSTGPKTIKKGKR